MGPSGPKGDAGVSPFSLNGVDAYYTDGFVGIGTSGPSVPLQVENLNTGFSGKILNLNSIINNGCYNNNIASYNNLNYYNSNKSLVLELNDKNNFRYLLKDKHNYFITFSIFKYKYNWII
jgi:hypothetical protein